MAYIEIAYAPINNQTIVKKIEFAPNLNVNSALRLSGLLELYPEIANFNIGIFKNIVTKAHMLKPNDRIEIYRPLLICPKEKRRKRAK